MKTKKEALFLRVEPEFNRRLKSLSEQSESSLNEYCVSVLKSSLASSLEFDHFGQIISKAKALYKNSLQSVVVFGSRARGDNTSESDLDVLLVLDSKISRELYTRWDNFEGDRAVGDRIEEDSINNLSIHFSNLPDSNLSGFWCEIALDGIIIFDKDLIVNKFLITLRNKILSGEFVARYSHGHRYWSLAA